MNLQISLLVTNLKVNVLALDLFQSELVRDQQTKSHLEYQAMIPRSEASQEKDLKIGLES